MKAKHYIYRNLHNKCFSVKHKGIVVEHIFSGSPFIVIGSFKVNEAGRQQVIKNKSKNVHAYVVNNHPIMHDYIPAHWENFVKREVTYNPYTNTGFVYRDTGEPATGNIILMDYPKVYCLEAE